jgi:lactobin A/cerein 7B family class IIb bacteriocin
VNKEYKMYKLTVQELNEVNGGIICGGACIVGVVIAGVGLGVAIGDRIWP